MSRFAEHFLRAPITAVSLLLVTSMVPAAPTPSLGRLVEQWSTARRTAVMAELAAAVELNRGIRSRGGQGMAR